MKVIKGFERIKFALWLAFFAWCLALNSIAPALADPNTNLIANPSVETVNTTAAPANWRSNNWGTNSTSMTYQDGGHTGSKSLYINMTSRTSGDAKWIFDPVTVSPGTSYTFSDYYQSSVDTELDAQYTDVNGKVTYAYLKYAPVKANWSQLTTTFTVPANITSVSIMHIIYSPGWLQTDDYSLTDNTSATPPQVSISNPINNAIVSGTQAISATATDSQTISSVQFKLDGSNLGGLITGSPWGYSWDTSSVSNGIHNITAVATNNSGLTTTSSPITVNVQNTTSPPPPGTNMINNPSVETTDASGVNPVSWSNNKWGTNSTTFSYQDGGHTGSKSLYINMASRTSGDAKWISSSVPVTPNTTYAFSDYYMSNVATELDAQFTDTNGNVSYAFLKNVPASTSWSQVSSSFTTPANTAKVTVMHIIYNAGWLQTDDYSLMIPSAPIVTLTAPSDNSTVSGTVQVTATASSVTGVKNVQFQIDGINLGTPITTSPYQTSWDTTTVSNGSHLLTALVASQDGKTATSQTVTVNVSNQAANTNMISNSSVETVKPTNTNLPKDWTHGSWGTNTTSFTYLTTGHTGSRSVKTQISSYTNGASYWYPSTNIAVTPGQIYDFSDYYQSNVISEIDAGINMSDGTQKSMYLGDGFASPNGWTKFDKQFTVPAGAVSVTFYHNIYKAGWLITDDYSLSPFSYQGLSRPIVSLTFDDGYSSFFNNGLPLLNKYGMKSTDYIVTSSLGQDAYMTSTQVKQLYVNGQDVQSHTVSHPDLVTLSAKNLDLELKNSQAYLQNLLGVPVSGLATPYGSANSQVITNAAQYYSYVRGVEAGYNAKNNFNPYNILVQNIKSTTTTAQVQQWVQQAIATNTWLVLVYHQVAPNLNPSTDPYNTYPADLDSELSYIKSTGVTVETMQQAFNEVTSQL
ncbi:polysaccharide deacetylase family protein [Candidatus Saccharibacteria bacterium]|nr:polysaccharide deacetylase family protein [Candidatus Saccharibacteria bacterium]